MIGDAVPMAGAGTAAKVSFSRSEIAESGANAFCRAFSHYQVPIKGRAGS